MPSDELLPDLLAEGGAGVLLDRVVDHLREVLVLPVAAGEADEREARRQQAPVGEVVDGRHQLLAGQVARDAEDDQARRPRDTREPSVRRRHAAGWLRSSPVKVVQRLRRGEALELRLGGLQQVVPGRLELLDALVLQQLHDLVVGDAEPLDGVEVGAGLLVGAGDRVAGDLAVVGGGVQGGLRHGVDRVGATSSSTYRVSLYAGSFTPVEAHSGRCLLAPAPAPGRPSASRGEDLLVRLVGEAGVGDGGLAA